MTACCAQLASLLKTSDAYRAEGGRLFLFGHPSFADDGDGHFDDMTHEYEAKFCPFCGIVQKTEAKDE